MANITAAMVSELRARTAVGMMDCKKALVECGGDMEKSRTHSRTGQDVHIHPQQLKARRTP